MTLKVIEQPKTSVKESIPPPAVVIDGELPV